jgi:hypothetical protein
MMETRNQHAPAGPERYISNEAPSAMSEDNPILSVEGLLQAMAELRVKFERTLAPLAPDAPDDDDTPIDTDALLQAVGELRSAFERTLTPDLRAALPKPAASDEAAPFMFSAVHKQAAMEDFAFESAIETMELLAEQARIVADIKRERAYHLALRIYYAMEDALAGDPDNAELAEHMENMQRAHLSQYGTPIPEREGEE